MTEIKRRWTKGLPETLVQAIIQLAQEPVTEDAMRAILVGHGLRIQKGDLRYYLSLTKKDEPVRHLLHLAKKVFNDNKPTSFASGRAAQGEDIWE